MGEKIALFAAIVLTALTLAPAAAHLLALPNKIALPEGAYFTVQGIYRGWALLGGVLIAAILAEGALLFLPCIRGAACGFSLAATLLLIVSLAVFWIWVFPGNQATDNWTVMRSDWQQLRRSWEYGHAASAVADFLAFCCATLALLSRMPG